MLRYLIPFDQFTLYSQLSPIELGSRLAKKVATGFWLFSKPSEPYSGKVFETGFRIIPVIFGRNSFLPVIVGRFEQEGLGTRIVVHQRMVIFVMAFMAFWFSGVILGVLLFALAPAELIEGDGTISRFIPILMLVFGLGLMNGGFWWEARHTKEDLKNVFAATEEPVGYY